MILMQPIRHHHLLPGTLQAAFVLLNFLPLAAQAVDPLQAQFNHPPASARPWVYWFWNNGNVTAGTMEFPVTRVAQPKDPAYGVVKTLHIEATVDGKARNWSGTDNDRVALLRSEDFRAPEATVWGTENPGAFVLATREGGEFRLKTASGKETTVTVPAMPEPLAIRGPWMVSFPPKWGAPPNITMQELASLSESEIEGVRHFSGVCTYQPFNPNSTLPKSGLMGPVRLGVLQETEVKF